MNNINYKTRTLDLAAFLSAKNIQLVDIERDGKQCEFIFLESERLHELVRSFLYEEEDGEQTQVDARKLLSALKDLKLKMYI
jgi:hypothetical protein